MRRPRLAALAIVALALALHVPVSRALAEGDESTTKSFDDKNFSITVPKGWTVEDPTEDDQKGGYVCVARRPVAPSVYASAWFLVANAGSTTLDAFFEQLRSMKVAKLEDQSVTGPETLAWGGAVDAKYMRIAGKSGGSKVVSRIYGAVVAGRYHQLEFRAFNGADEKVAAEIDAIAEGYKFLKGGTGAASTKPKGTDGAPPEDGLAKVDPEKASARIEKYHLAWNLPKPPKADEAPFWKFTPLGLSRLGSSGDDTPSGRAKESLALLEPAQATDGNLQVLLRAGVVEPGFLPSAAVSEDDNFRSMVSSLFDGTPVPNVDQEVSLGNWHGASRSYTGKGKDGKGLYVRLIFAVLKGVSYDFQISGSDGSESRHLDDIKRALAGLRWDDVNEGVRGPWAAPFKSATDERKDWIDFGKDATRKAGVVTVKKPAAFGVLKFSASEEAFSSWLHAFEARKQGAYCFVGIQRFDYAWMQRSIPPREPDALIDEFESTWKNAVAEAKTLTQRSGKANKTAASLAGARGSTYEFEGLGDGKPFVERGWVLKSGQHVIWIRAQFGGKDAETILAADFKKLLQSIRIE